MMTFAISISDSEGPYGCGQITLGPFSELFECPLEFWDGDDYQDHCYESIRRVVLDRRDSCLITSITDPETANFVFWWPIYLIGEKDVAFQNEVLFLEGCPEQFDPDNPFCNLSERRMYSDDGGRISEWRIPLGSLVTWLQGCKP